MRAKAFCLIMLLMGQLYAADDLSAIGFFDGEKVHVAFVRTSERWQAACFYETQDITERADTEHCAKNLFEKPWDVLDYGGKHIKAGMLVWLGNFLSSTDFSFEMPLKIKTNIPPDAPKMYMWGGKVYHPLLVVPSGTVVTKMSANVPSKIDRQLQSKLTALYLQKTRKIYGCEKGTEKALFEKTAKSKDLAVTPLEKFSAGYSFYKVALNLPQEAQYCGLVDNESELFAVKGAVIVNLTAPLNEEHRPIGTGLTLWGGIEVSVGKKKERLFIMLAGGYNINGFVLFDEDLRLLGTSTWNYH
ncbi:MAG TPA: hypothetical protein P5077_09315 [bacterium]|nr:hypothetical protein [bacterium]